ncbi:hypothetical protein [Lentzea californiensis]|nr:hypothetical protein [Lentzea californiensis]
MTRPDQPDRDAARTAAVAEMVKHGPQRTTIGPDGSLVPVTEPS